MNNIQIEELKREAGLRKPSVGSAEFQIAFDRAIEASPKADGEALIGAIVREIGDVAR